MADEKQASGDAKAVAEPAQPANAQRFDPYKNFKFRTTAPSETPSTGTSPAPRPKP